MRSTFPAVSGYVLIMLAQHPSPLTALHSGIYRDHYRPDKQGSQNPSSTLASMQSVFEQLLCLYFAQHGHFVTAIHSVTVSNHRADFIHYDPLTNLSVSDPKDLHTHPELRRKVYSALADGDEGELSIAIPKEVSLKQSGSTTGVVVSEGVSIFGSEFSSLGLILHSCTVYQAATPEPQTPGFAVAHTPVAIPEFSPITVNIEYSLRHPVDGLQFIVPSDAYPYVSVCY